MVLTVDSFFTKLSIINETVELQDLFVDFCKTQVETIPLSLFKHMGSHEYINHNDGIHVHRFHSQFPGSLFGLLISCFKAEILRFQVVNIKNKYMKVHCNKG